jgi:iron complex transport system substrate-binding protein
MTTILNTMNTKLTMRTMTLLSPFLIVAVVSSWLIVLEPSARHSHTSNQTKPSRIVCIIPAVTEMLFAIGAGPQVVAVGTFDQYPPDVKPLPRVGALLDPDLERILSLRPDLVIVYESQTDFRRQLERASIPTFVYKHAGLADITETITQLGSRVGHAAEAATVVKAIDDRLREIRGRVEGRPRPSTLLVFGRDAMALRGIYASGGVGFLHDMVAAAGGINVFADVKKQSVQATTELILARRPQAIVELRSGDMSPEQQLKELALWRRLPGVPAVRSGRIVMITDPRTVIPGPRVAEGTELIARALHPKAFPEDGPPKDVR